MMAYKIDFDAYDTYLKYKNIFSSCRIKVGSGFFSSTEPDTDPGEKCWILILGKTIVLGGEGGCRRKKGIGEKCENKRV